MENEISAAFLRLSFLNKMFFIILVTLLVWKIELIFSRMTALAYKTDFLHEY